MGRYINKELVYWFWRSVRPKDRAGNHFLCQMLAVNFSLNSEALKLKKFMEKKLLVQKELLNPVTGSEIATSWSPMRLKI